MLWGERFHGRPSSDERLYTKRKEGGRELKSFNKVYDETKTRMACYTASSIMGGLPSGIRSYVDNQDPGSIPTRCLDGLWDPTSLRGSP